MTAVNAVPRADLDIHCGATLKFACEWWSDAAGTVPVAIASVVGKVKADSTETIVLLNLATYAAIGGAGGNVATITVPPGITIALAPLDRAVWDIMLVSVAGETKKVARGNVRIHASVSA